MSKKHLVQLLIILSIFLITIFYLTKNEHISKAYTEINNERIGSELIVDIGKSLFKANYIFGLDYNVAPDEKVTMNIKMNEEIIKEIKENIKSITNNVIVNNNYNADDFKVTVSNYPNKPISETNN